MPNSSMNSLNLGFFSRLRLGWRLLRDPRVPAWPKLVAPIVTLLYVVSPVDVLPDFIPVLGQLDDLGVVAIALAVISMLAQWSPPAIVEQHMASLGASMPAGWRHRTERGDGGEPIEARGVKGHLALANSCRPRIQST